MDFPKIWIYEPFLILTFARAERLSMSDLLMAVNGKVLWQKGEYIQPVNTITGPWNLMESVNGSFILFFIFPKLLVSGIGCSRFTKLPEMRPVTGSKPRLALTTHVTGKMMYETSGKTVYLKYNLRAAAQCRRPLKVFMITKTQSFLVHV